MSEDERRRMAMLITLVQILIREVQQLETRLQRAEEFFRMLRGPSG